jgi:hypothetical protein
MGCRDRGYSGRLEGTCEYARGDTTVSDLFPTGIRPAVDTFLLKKSQEERDYGQYWSASSAGYCKRKVIFDRLKVPKTSEDARKTRVFEVGHIFHEWMQRITKDAGLSVAQEFELQDESLMVRGHIDDLVLVEGGAFVDYLDEDQGTPTGAPGKKNLILYDYKTVNSRSFTWAKKNGDQMSRYHRMQLGTYMYMLRRQSLIKRLWESMSGAEMMKIECAHIEGLEQARILKISKDDLRMSEQQLMWSLELESDVLAYWGTLSGFWASKTIPRCTCSEVEGGFMAREAYNDYFYEGEPCSVKWLVECIKEKKVNAAEWKAEKV